MRRAILGVLAVLALAGCDVPFLSSSPPAPTPTDIAPADAVKVVNDFWAARESALVKLNGSPLDAVEAGDLNTVDRGIIDLRVKVKAPGLPAARALANVKAYAPHQKDYPAQFLATGETQPLDANAKPAGNPLTNLFIFVKPDPDTPYKAVMYTVKDPAQTLPELNVDKDGFAALVPAEGQAADYKLGSSQLGNLYGDTMNALTKGQNPPTAVFAAGANTTQGADDIKAAVAQAAAAGVQLKIDFAGTTTTANYAYQTKDGNALDFFETSASVSANSVGGIASGCIVFLGGGLISQGIVPGAYKVLAYTDVAFGTAVVPKTADKDKLVTMPGFASGPRDLNASPC